MSPKDYCTECHDIHDPEVLCADYQAAKEEARRQWYINNPHSCHQCRAA